MARPSGGERGAAPDRPLRGRGDPRGRLRAGSAGAGRCLSSELSQEELAAQLAEELRKLRVEDVLVNTLVQVSSIGYRRLGLTEDTTEDRDLEQSRLAIETMRALVPVLEGFLPHELVAGFQEQVANLQLAYAKAATATEAEGEEEASADG